MSASATLNRVRITVYDSPLARRLRAVALGLQHRWRALTFARRFYQQARNAPPPIAEGRLPAPDFSESLVRRSVAPRLHELVQLRVASQIASVTQTELRSQLCRAHGWSNEQIGAALLGVSNGCFSSAEKLVLQYAEDITRTPIDVDPQVFKQLRTHFSEAELMELTISIAHENFRARLTEAARRLR